MSNIILQMRKLKTDLLKDTINDKVNLELNYIFTKPASSQLKYAT